MKKFTEPIEFIVIHHSLTRDSETVSWNAIRKYHIDVQQWDDIGYHYGIELIGDRYETLIGRDSSFRGAHCIPVNKNSIGICCVGNYDEIAPPQSLLDRVVPLVRWLREVYQIPVNKIRGHREFAPDRTCPGVLFDMEHFRSLI